jgi:hypothetical protein
MNIKGTLIAATVAGLFSSAGSLALAQDKQKDGDKVMCSGINACKGHGACAGAGNACAGHNGCKGQGQTKTTKKDCEAKGGKVVVAKKDKEKK